MGEERGLKYERAVRFEKKALGAVKIVKKIDHDKYYKTISKRSIASWVHENSNLFFVVELLKHNKGLSQLLEGIAIQNNAVACYYSPQDIARIFDFVAHINGLDAKKTIHVNTYYWVPVAFYGKTTVRQIPAVDKNPFQGNETLLRRLTNDITDIVIYRMASIPGEWVGIYEWLYDNVTAPKDFWDMLVLLYTDFDLVINSLTIENIVGAFKQQLKEKYAKITHPNPWIGGYEMGKLMGYMKVEIVITYFSGGLWGAIGQLFKSSKYSKPFQIAIGKIRQGLIGEMQVASPPFKTYYDKLNNVWVKTGLGQKTIRELTDPNVLEVWQLAIKGVGPPQKGMTSTAYYNRVRDRFWDSIRNDKRFAKQKEFFESFGYEFLNTGRAPVLNRMYTQELFKGKSIKAIAIMHTMNIDHVAPGKRKYLTPHQAVDPGNLRFTFGWANNLKRHDLAVIRK